MKKLTELSPEEKCILAAEACGWKHEYKTIQTLRHSRLVNPSGEVVHKYGFGPKAPSASAIIKRLKEWPLYKIPDYGSDLNACAELEETLTEDQCDAFDEALGEILETREHPASFRIWHSTAARRLDAFLIAKGLRE